MKANSFINLKVVRINPLTPSDRHPHFYYNHIKLNSWKYHFNQDTVFVDCDMMLLDDISDGFDHVEHIGITERPDKYRFNGGVVFIRNTPDAKRFLRKWIEIDGRMLRDVEFHKPYKDKYAGMNQASMGWMWENRYWKRYIKILPCATYNLCQPWDNWEEAKLIHVKSQLRKYIFGRRDPLPIDVLSRVRALNNIWYNYTNQEILEMIER